MNVVYSCSLLGVRGRSHLSSTLWQVLFTRLHCDLPSSSFNTRTITSTGTLHFSAPSLMPSREFVVNFYHQIQVVDALVPLQLPLMVCGANDIDSTQAQLYDERRKCEGEAEKEQAVAKRCHSKRQFTLCTLWIVNCELATLNLASRSPFQAIARFHAHDWWPIPIRRGNEKLGEWKDCRIVLGIISHAHDSSGLYPNLRRAVTSVKWERNNSFRSFQFVSIRFVSKYWHRRLSLDPWYHRAQKIRGRGNAMGPRVRQKKEFERFCGPDQLAAWQKQTWNRAQRFVDSIKIKRIFKTNSIHSTVSRVMSLLWPLFHPKYFFHAIHFHTFFIVSTSFYTVLPLFAFNILFAWRTSISYLHFCTTNVTRPTPDQQHCCLRLWRRTVAVAVMHGLPYR